MRTHRVGSHTPEESRRSSDLGHRVEGLILAAVALLALVAGLTRAPWAATVWPWLAMIAGLLLLIALYLTHPPSDWPKSWRDPRQRRHTIIAAAVALGGACRSWLWPLGSKAPAWRRWTEVWLLGPGAFSQRYVFPDGELVPVSEANLTAEAAGFEVHDFENLREHYALTLRQWVRRLEARREDSLQASDEITYRTWRLFLSASALGFERGQISVNQTLLAKPDRGQVHLPLTRAYLYSEG
ncbi:MAG TPA: class I SAM-dependent methyltransferase [Anaerolineales bacterium]|nr:class I SAM-dependent methyltransferase [Anaerolineales bacterium]